MRRFMGSKLLKSTVMRTIKINDTLNRQKLDLQLLQPGKIGIYACGVTVYDDCHLGHAMQAIYFDIIRSYLKYCGYDVKYVRNYTDVDDKIIARAKLLNISPNKLATDMIANSQRDMRSIGVLPADAEPRVSEMIPQIIAMVQTLIEKDFAYKTKDGDVYYRVRKKADYGKLSNRKPDDMRAGARDIVVGDKEDELDFALWKSDSTPDASWDSPWGKGRPGWHIECSAMAKETLGARFEIHGGGRDLVFPHHENEIAQSEAANGCTFANHWLHSGLLNIEHQKMSKSLGNHITIKKFLEDWPAEVLRLAFLQNQYSSNVDFSLQGFQNAFKRLLYYYETLQLVLDQKVDVSAVKADPDLIEKFHEAMSNDFNTPLAVSCINVAMRGVREALAGKKSQPILDKAAGIYCALREIGKVLGILQEDPKLFLEKSKARILPQLKLTPEYIQNAIQSRTAARANKDFAKSDAIRDELLAKGIELRDSPQGTTWGIKYSGE